MASAPSDAAAVAAGTSRRTPRSRTAKRPPPPAPKLDEQETTMGEALAADDDKPETSRPRKRKRSKKVSSRKFDCPVPECGRSYSRAEHLYRHQLNHNPKEVYVCDFPGCEKSFVRQDLRARHTERHQARHPQLARRQSSGLSNRLGKEERLTGPKHGRINREESATDEMSGKRIDYRPATSQTQSQVNSDLYATGYSSYVPLANTQSYAQYMSPAKITSSPHPLPKSGAGHLESFSSLPQPSMPLQQGAIPRNPSRASLPSPSWSGASDPTHNQDANPEFAGTTKRYLQPEAVEEAPDTNYQNSMSVSQAPTLLDSNSNAFSFQYPDELTAWLFESSSQPTYFGGPDVQNVGIFSESFPFILQDLDLMQEPSPPAPIQQHPMTLSSIIDTSLPESKLSEEKRQKLIQLMTDKFNDNDQVPERRQKTTFLQGDKDEDTHVLSLNMMQTYIASYWIHFHPQVPILHKATFWADECQDLLLLAVMALGASCLEGVHGHSITQACSEFAVFVAWHLRWALFRNEASRPPAQLWIFQALLLLEFYEKMYSTLEIHERSHVHHATTLFLMRRGSSLVGKSAVEPGSHSPDRSSRACLARGGLPFDPWWDHWISKESTRRCVFAAFVMDTMHAIMFGHSAVMAAHDMRLPLPCDEAVWSATSGAEVMRLESSVGKPASFLESLKCTLHRQSVKTNPFGRTVVMAGLLSLSWHLNQRDLQLHSLGVSKSSIGAEKWRISMTRAFTFWKEDFDAALDSSSLTTQKQQYSHRNDMDDENVFESRTVMLHLAQMAMHADLVDCQVFAGSTSLLGRNVTPHDHAAACRRIRQIWAPSARARVAAFHALKFVSQVLTPDVTLDANDNSDKTATANSNSPLKRQPSSSSSPPTKPLDHEDRYVYSAREDNLLNRPWIVYFAALIIWCYGYAIDGPISTPTSTSTSTSISNSVLSASTSISVPGAKSSAAAAAPPPPPLTTKADKIRAMRAFLQRVGGVSSPEELLHVDRRNECMGLLMVLRDLFDDTRWELLHNEAAGSIRRCIEMLVARSGGCEE